MKHNRMKVTGLVILTVIFTALLGLSTAYAMGNGEWFVNEHFGGFVVVDDQREGTVFWCFNCSDVCLNDTQLYFGAKGNVTLTAEVTGEEGLELIQYPWDETAHGYNGCSLSLSGEVQGDLDLVTLSLTYHCTDAALRGAGYADYHVELPLHIVTERDVDEPTIFMQGFEYGNYVIRMDEQITDLCLPGMDLSVATDYYEDGDMDRWWISLSYDIETINITDNYDGTRTITAVKPGVTQVNAYLESFNYSRFLYSFDVVVTDDPAAAEDVRWEIGSTDTSTVVLMAESDVQGAFAGQYGDIGYRINDWQTLTLGAGDYSIEVLSVTDDDIDYHVETTWGGMPQFQLYGCNDEREFVAKLRLSIKDDNLKDANYRDKIIYRVVRTYRLDWIEKAHIDPETLMTSTRSTGVGTPVFLEIPETIGGDSRVGWWVSYWSDSENCEVYEVNNDGYRELSVSSDVPGVYHIMFNVQATNYWHDTVEAFRTVVVTPNDDYCNDFSWDVEPTRVGYYIMTDHKTRLWVDEFRTVGYGGEEEYLELSPLQYSVTASVDDPELASHVSVGYVQDDGCWRLVFSDMDDSFIGHDCIVTLTFHSDIADIEDAEVFRMVCFLREDEVRTPQLDGWGVPEIVNLSVGQETVIEGPRFDGGDQRIRWWFWYETRAEESELQCSVDNYDQGHCRLALKGLEPGYYTINVRLDAEGWSMYTPCNILVIVSDEQQVYDPGWDLEYYRFNKLLVTGEKHEVSLFDYWGDIGYWLWENEKVHVDCGDVEFSFVSCTNEALTPHIVVDKTLDEQGTVWYLHLMDMDESLNYENGLITLRLHSKTGTYGDTYIYRYVEIVPAKHVEFATIDMSTLDTSTIVLEAGDTARRPYPEICGGDGSIAWWVYNYTSDDQKVFCYTEHDYDEDRDYLYISSDVPGSYCLYYRVDTLNYWDNTVWMVPIVVLNPGEEYDSDPNWSAMDGEYHVVGTDWYSVGICNYDWISYKNTPLEADDFEVICDGCTNPNVEVFITENDTGSGYEVELTGVKHACEFDVYLRLSLTDDDLKDDSYRDKLITVHVLAKNPGDIMFAELDYNTVPDSIVFVAGEGIEIDRPRLVANTGDPQMTFWSQWDLDWHIDLDEYNDKVYLNCYEPGVYAWNLQVHTNGAASKTLVTVPIIVQETDAPYQSDARWDVEVMRDNRYPVYSTPSDINILSFEGTIGYWVEDEIVDVSCRDVQITYSCSDSDLADYLVLQQPTLENGYCWHLYLRDVDDSMANEWMTVTVRIHPLVGDYGDALIYRTVEMVPFDAMEKASINWSTLDQSPLVIRAGDTVSFIRPETVGGEGRMDWCVCCWPDNEMLEVHDYWDGKAGHSMISVHADTPGTYLIMYNVQAPNYWHSDVEASRVVIVTQDGAYDNDPCWQLEDSRVRGYMLQDYETAYYVDDFGDIGYDGPHGHFEVLSVNDYTVTAVCDDPDLAENMYLLSPDQNEDGVWRLVFHGMTEDYNGRNCLVTLTFHSDKPGIGDRHIYRFLNFLCKDENTTVPRMDISNLPSAVYVSVGDTVSFKSPWLYGGDNRVNWWIWRDLRCSEDSPEASLNVYWDDSQNCDVYALTGLTEGICFLDLCVDTDCWCTGVKYTLPVIVTNDEPAWEDKNWSCLHNFILTELSTEEEKDINVYWAEGEMYGEPGDETWLTADNYLIEASQVAGPDADWTLYEPTEEENRYYLEVRGTTVDTERLVFSLTFIYRDVPTIRKTIYATVDFAPECEFRKPNLDYSTLPDGPVYLHVGETVYIQEPRVDNTGDPRVEWWSNWWPIDLNNIVTWVDKEGGGWYMTGLEPGTGYMWYQVETHDLSIGTQFIPVVVLSEGQSADDIDLRWYVHTQHEQALFADPHATGQAWVFYFDTVNHNVHSDEEPVDLGNCVITAEASGSATMSTEVWNGNVYGYISGLTPDMDSVTVRVTLSLPAAQRDAAYRDYLYTFTLPVYGMDDIQLPTVKAPSAGAITFYSVHAGDEIHDVAFPASNHDGQPYSMDWRYSFGYPYGIARLGDVDFENGRVSFKVNEPGVYNIEFHFGLYNYEAPTNYTITVVAHANDGVMRLPGGLTVIGEEAFAGNAVTEVILPAGVTTIGARAFAGMDICLITIPSSVTSIANDAFSGCDYLTILCDSDYVQQYAEANDIPFVREP